VSGISRSIIHSKKGDYAYWQSRTTAERMSAVAELTREAYAKKGIDADAPGPRTFRWLTHEAWVRSEEESAE